MKNKTFTNVPDVMTSWFKVFMLLIEKRWLQKELEGSFSWKANDSSVVQREFEGCFGKDCAGLFFNVLGRIEKIADKKFFIGDKFFLVAEK